MARRVLRVLVAKPGLDGHDRGAKVIAHALRDAGMEVIYLGLHRGPEEIVTAAEQEDVDVIGLSILSGAHMQIMERLLSLMEERGVKGIRVVVGGCIPEKDIPRLRKMGVSEVFTMHDSLDAVVGRVASLVKGVHPPKRRMHRPAVPPTGGSGELERVVLESGIEVRPVYTPRDVRHEEYEVSIADPGVYPFTRGIHPLMYRKRPWTMRQYAGFGTPRETNRRFMYLLEHGQNALNVAFDLPTQMGLDSDDPRAEGEVGRVGMAVDSLLDMEAAFRGIPLQQVSTSLTINATAPILLAMYLVLTRKQGIPPQSVRGTLQNDILKEFIGRGAWIYPVAPSVSLVVDIIEHCARYLPRYYPVSVCGYHIRESGADPAQEIAFAFTIAEAYIQHTLDRGLDIDTFAPRISFNFDIFGNMFEQVAKFRAARRLWARLINEKYGAKDPRSMMMKMIAGGGGGGLTIVEPENNIVRGAYYALVSALSGTQTMALCSYDEAYTIPTERSALISLRTMQILMEEMGLRDTVDPLGGSYYVEWLTDEMEGRILRWMGEVEQMGGIEEGVASGRVQRLLARQAYEYEARIRSGEVPKVGVNRFVSREAAGRTGRVRTHPYRERSARAKVRALQRLKRRRDPRKIARLLDGVRSSAEMGENVIPAVMKAVEAYATVGEVSSALEEVYGRFREPVEL